MLSNSYWLWIRHRLRSTELSVKTLKWSVKISFNILPPYHLKTTLNSLYYIYQYYIILTISYHRSKGDSRALVSSSLNDSGAVIDQSLRSRASANTQCHLTRSDRQFQFFYQICIDCLMIMFQIQSSYITSPCVQIVVRSITFLGMNITQFLNLILCGLLCSWNWTQEECLQTQWECQHAICVLADTGGGASRQEECQQTQDQYQQKQEEWWERELNKYHIHHKIFSWWGRGQIEYYIHHEIFSWWGREQNKYHIHHEIFSWWGREHSIYYK